MKTNKVSESQEFPKYDQNGPINAKATKRHNALKQYFAQKGWDFRNDIVRNRIMWRAFRGEYTSLDLSTIWEVVAHEHGRVSKDYIANTIMSRNISPHFNPVKSWLESSKYDKEVDYLRQLCDYIILSNPLEKEKERLYVSLKKWFVGAIKTLYDPDYVHKQAVVFEGPQRIGKTPFVRSLLPKKMRDFMNDAATLNLETKDARIALTTSFIISFDEIQDFFKTQKNRDMYKSFMSQKYVNVRLPYGKTEVCRQRITAFVGTCNEGDFLGDPTGTTRFTVFSLQNFKNKDYGGDKCVEDFDIEKVWAQAYHLFVSGFNPEYTRKELDVNEEANEMYKYNNEESDTIVKWLVPAKKGDEGAEFMTATDMCAYLNGKQEAVKFFNRSLGKILIRYKYKKNKKKVNGQSIYGYYVRKLQPEVEINNSVITNESLDKFRELNL